jgi:transcriptional regulator with XRE-family HTH domain
MKLQVEKLSASLIKGRLSKGYSQSYIAEQLGISQKAYSILESGHCRIDLVRFLYISHHIELHPMEIIEAAITGSPSWARPLKVYDDCQFEINDLRSRIKDLEEINSLLKGVLSYMIGNKGVEGNGEELLDHFVSKLLNRNY